MIKTIINYVNYHYEKSRKELKDFPLLSNDDDINECFIKTSLIYKYLYELYFRKNITLFKVMYVLNYGVFTLTFGSNSTVLKNHLIFHYAFTKFKKRYKVGRGSLYLIDSRINSSFVGFIMGIVYWFFHKGLV